MCQDELEQGYKEYTKLKETSPDVVTCYEGQEEILPDFAPYETGKLADEVREALPKRPGRKYDMTSHQRCPVCNVTKQSEIHEHPFFNGQYHEAVWVRTWASTGTSDEMPEDAPVLCAICGRVKE